jgi:hypothetical protein
MRCRRCERDAYLIRGMCAVCDPELHASRRAAAACYVEAERAYQKETGRTALEAWRDFIAWVGGPHPAAVALVAAAARAESATLANELLYGSGSGRPRGILAGAGA